MNRILKRIATYLENNTINTNISQNESDESYENVFNSQTILINLNASSKLKSLLKERPVYKYENIGFLKPAICGDSFTNSKNEDIVIKFYSTSYIFSASLYQCHLTIHRTYFIS